MLTGGLGALAAAATHLTGYGSEEASSWAIFQGTWTCTGCCWRGSSSVRWGVLDDVTVTQAATVAELAQADPGMSRVRLYRAATRVGRAHIASTVNTIVLAYAGASLPLLLVLTAGSRAGEPDPHQRVPRPGDRPQRGRDPGPGGRGAAHHRVRRPGDRHPRRRRDTRARPGGAPAATGRAGGGPGRGVRRPAPTAGTSTIRGARRRHPDRVDDRRP